MYDEGTAQTWRAIAEDALGGVNAKCHKLLGVQHGQLHHLTHLLYLLLAAADVRVGHVWLLLYRHHSHCGIDLGRQGDLDLVLGAINPESHSCSSWTLDSDLFLLKPAKRR